ncbi:MAG: hypothetical protein IKH54_07310 [Bacilli bacterium]|nr:hypothetical protein [Bacilli bacterium]
MSYADWLDLLEKFNNTNLDNESLEKLLSLDGNPAFNERLVPVFGELIGARLQLSTNKIIDELNNIFDDQNYMDFMLVSFKKEVNYLIKMLDVKILDQADRIALKAQIKEKVDKIYELLDKKALEIDYTGVLSMLIKSNGIKWS